jgi:hypothetical protein
MPALASVPEAAPRAWTASLAPIAALSAAWWLASAVANPIGDFPLNDDWGYGPAVRALVEDGALRFTNWQSMPLLSHVLWGALFCLPFGFSYTALRFATLTAGWLGVLALYAMIRRLGGSRTSASIGAATLAFNPIYFGLAHTFMTDVTFVAALIGACAAWLEANARGSAAWRVIATLLAIVATLDRQLGVALPVAWTIAHALRHGMGWRWLKEALFPALVVLASLIVYERTVDATIGLPALYHAKTRELAHAAADVVRLRGLRFPIQRSLMALAYLGFFTLPVTALMWRSIEMPRALRFSPILFALVFFGLALAGVAMPMTGNIWIDFGMGPRTAPGSIEGAPMLFMAAITALAGAGAIAFSIAIGKSAAASGIVGAASPRKLPARIWRGLRGRERDDARGAPHPSDWLVCALTALIAYAPTSIAYGAFFDRYLLAQLPFAIALVLAAHDRRAAIAPSSVRAAAFALSLAIAFTVPAAHDYLGWQRARWAAVDRLERRGIDREEIRGGFEVDNSPPSAGEAMISRDKSRYVVAISALAGHERLDRVELGAWLPWSVGAIHVLEREEGEKPRALSAR